MYHSLQSHGHHTFTFHRGQVRFSFRNWLMFLLTVCHESFNCNVYKDERILTLQSASCLHRKRFKKTGTNWNQIAQQVM